MGRMYSAVFEKVAVAAAQDLFEVIAPADAAVVIHAVYFGQDIDFGDAEAELIGILMHRDNTSPTSGSGGSVPTAQPLSAGDAAFGGTTDVNNTTQAAEGAMLHADTWNVAAGYQMIWTPETRPVIAPSGMFIVEIQVAPTDSITMSGTIYFEELGG